MTSKQHLETMFQAERTLRAAEAELLRIPTGELTRLLGSAVDEALGLGQGPEASLRLERLADLCAQVPGPAMVDTLIKVLASDAGRVRVQAAEALVDVAYERYAEVARAVERAVADPKTSSQALEELPWVIAEVAEPSAVRLLARFLAHSDPLVVASAVEALAELGDPEAVPVLSALKDDPRQVALDEYEGEVTSSLGELAREAIDGLQGDAAVEHD
jgi:HEAT repeat protein